MTQAAKVQDDARLIIAARKGKIDAFESLVARYRGRVFSLALRMLQNPSDAEEVTQETFLSAYQHLPKFRGESQFGSWLHRICANFCLMRLRHKKVADAVEGELDVPGLDEAGHWIITGASYDWSRRADEQVADAELRQVIEQAVAKLHPEHRAVFLLKDVEGLSYEEIGEAVGASVPAVKSRLHRARLALRQDIDAFFTEHRH